MMGFELKIFWRSYQGKMMKNFDVQNKVDILANHNL
jgi:hypothetical protein